MSEEESSLKGHGMWNGQVVKLSEGRERDLIINYFGGFYPFMTLNLKASSFGFMLSWSMKCVQEC